MRYVKSLGYIGAHTTDLRAWREFARDVLGLETLPDSDGSRLYLKMDELHHRLTVYAGDTDDVAHVGWDVGDSTALAAARRALEAAGVTVTSGGDEERRERCVIDLLWFDCPYTGVRMELFTGAETQFRPRFAPARPMGGFVTGDRGMGHVVLYVTDLDAAVRFYTGVLGFGVTDWEVAPGLGNVAAFLHCNERHHSLGFLSAWGNPRRMQHMLMETDDIDTVGSTYDLAEERDIVSAALGRHRNDRTFSCYFRTPSGWHMEYGWGSRGIDPATWRTESYDISRSDTAWGHRGIDRMV
ncbi:VOC family protein [Streptomyces sp. NPDC004539]|uniref:VOC family protein n=1 Tax=Streptomyces sp. NPDC004539 TaxID=3154280 RepID=UPI00339F3DD3